MTSNAKLLQKLQLKYANFNIKPYLKTGLSKNEILQMKEAFDLFDTEYKGYLELDSLKESLNEMGMCSKNDQISRLQDEGVEKVDFGDFINLMGAKTSCKSKEEVKKLYSIFLGDTDFQKNLSVEEFTRVASELEMELAPNEIEEMIEACHPKEKGEISFDEFYVIMMKLDSK